MEGNTPPPLNYGFSKRQLFSFQKKISEAKSYGVNENGVDPSISTGAKKRSYKTTTFFKQNV